MRELIYKITEKHDGVRADDYLKREHGYSSRVIKKIKLDKSCIELNGSHIRMVDRLKSGDTLIIRLPEDERELRLSEIKVPIAYEDDDVIVFDKPADMPCHPSLKHPNDTLGNVFAMLCAERKTPLTFRPVNRLDKDTSGLVVVAKNAYMAAQLAGNVDKSYIALCGGRFSEDFGTVDIPIGRMNEDEIARYVTPLGQEAVTHYRVMQRFNNYTLLCIKLDTGRTHQIRVHFSSQGHPLAGDTLYGGDMSLISRQALHCCEVRFLNRISGKTIEVSSDLCKDMEKAVKLAASEKADV